MVTGVVREPTAGADVPAARVLVNLEAAGHQACHRTYVRYPLGIGTERRSNVNEDLSRGVPGHRAGCIIDDALAGQLV
jgi:hypothetical protein